MDDFDDKNLLSKNISAEDLADLLAQKNELDTAENLDDKLDASFSGVFGEPVGTDIHHVEAYEILPIQDEVDPEGYVGVPLFISMQNTKGLRFVGILLDFNDQQTGSSEWLIAQVSDENLLNYLKGTIDKYQLLETAEKLWISYPDVSKHLTDLTKEELDEISQNRHWHNYLYHENMVLYDGNDKTPNEANEIEFINNAYRGQI